MCGTALGCNCVRMTACQDVRMSGCQDVRMSGCLDVRMSGCQDVRMSGCQDVRMSGCQDYSMPVFILCVQWRISCRMSMMWYVLSLDQNKSVYSIASFVMVEFGKLDNSLKVVCNRPKRTHRLDKPFWPCRVVDKIVQSKNRPCEIYRLVWSVGFFKY